MAVGKSCPFPGFPGKFFCLPIDCKGCSQLMAYGLQNRPSLSLVLPHINPAHLWLHCSCSQLGTLCSLISRKPVSSLLALGPARFQEVLLAALMEGTQCLGCRHIPCRWLSGASSWEDGAGRGEMSGACREWGLGRAWPWRQPGLGTQGLRFRHIHHYLSPSYIPRRAG